MADVNYAAEVVSVPAHTTLRFIAERQAKERSQFAMAVSLLSSGDDGDVNTGRDLLEQVQVKLANDQINLQRQIQRRYQEQW